jgi:hypothetical protein
MNQPRKQSLSLVLGMLMLGASLLTAGTTAANAPQPRTDDHPRTYVIGYGIFDRYYTGRIWAPYFHVWWAVSGWHLYGPRHDFDLFQMGFHGFIIPIRHCPTPIVGYFDYYIPWPNPPFP